MEPAISRVIWFDLATLSQRFRDFYNQRDAMHFAADVDGTITYFPPMDEEDWEE